MLTKLKELNIVPENKIKEMEKLQISHAKNEVICFIFSTPKKAKDLYEAFKTMGKSEVAYHIRKAVEAAGGNLLVESASIGKIKNIYGIFAWDENIYLFTYIHVFAYFHIPVNNTHNLIL